MLAVVLAAMLVGAWLAATYRENGSRAILLPDQVMTLFPDPKPLTAFALTDHENRVFDLSRLKGKWSFLFLGYTYCPDICPTTLATLARAHENIKRVLSVPKTSNSSSSQSIPIAIRPASSGNT